MPLRTHKAILMSQLTHERQPANPPPTVEETYTNTVGKRAEQAVKSFLEGDGYKVIPYGVEHTLKDVVNLGPVIYSRLCLEKVVSSAPDFFVLPPQNQICQLLEVKYRSCWSDLTRSGLKEDLEPQTQCWKKVFALIAIKIPVGTDGSPSSYIRACELGIVSGKLNAVTQGNGGLKEWDEVQWDDLHPIEGVFTSCCQDDASKCRLSNLVKSIREMPEKKTDKNLKWKIWKIWKNLYPTKRI